MVRITRSVCFWRVKSECELAAATTKSRRDRTLSGKSSASTPLEG